MKGLTKAQTVKRSYLQQEAALRDSWSGLEEAVEKNKTAVAKFCESAKRFAEKPVENPNILVVTPNEALSVHLLKALQLTFSCEGVVCVSAKLALQEAQNHPQHLIVVDLELEDRPGWELITDLRRESLRPLVPIVVTSSHPIPELDEIAAKAGANAVLQKPFDATSLKGIIKRLFNLDKTGDFPVLASVGG